MTRRPTTAAAILILASALTAAELPVRHVQLFSSGVGFFLHEGTVTDTATVRLRFKTEQINDILKSLVLQDLSGGQVGVVTYASKDPIEKTLRSFGVDITGRPTLGQLLDQLRGAPIEVSALKTITGVILGVEQQRITLDDRSTMIIDVLNVLTADGIVAVPLREVQRVRLLDEQIDSELREALGVLAGSHDAQKKPVDLQFIGRGERTVRAGYVMESPIWKTTYRLVLGDNDEALLQGWATVENATDEDWQDVELTLVSGRPISFIMDLYTPLYVPRPLVVPELYASLRPPTYEADLGEEAGAMRERPAMRRAPAAPRAARAEVFTGDLQQTKHAPGFGKPAGVESMARAQMAGEVFTYRIATPVTLDRQQSALLPIVNQPIEVERLSVYNPDAHDKFPLRGLRIDNTTGLVLMQGPITVFDGDTYAGDARLMDLPRNEKRLISYALDLDVEVAPEPDFPPSELVSIRIAKGTLIARSTYFEQCKYVIRNNSDDRRTLIIEQEFMLGWELVEPAEPFEKTRDMWRFRKDVDAHSSDSLTVRLERIGEQRIALMDTGLDDIRIYLRSKVISPAVIEALQRVVAMRTEIDRLQAQRQQHEAGIRAIDEDQQRIRQNMSRLPQNSELFTRYVTKLDQQETEIEDLRTRLFEVSEQQQAKRQALQDYLLALEIE